MASYGMVCPFLNENPTFAYGVEFGFLYSRMRDETIIDDYFCRKNQDQILLLASRLGWQIVIMKAVDKYWIRIRMEKDGGILQ